MAKRSDMSKPVTRGELVEDLESFDQKLDRKLDRKLDQYATKADLEIWGGALSARIGGVETRLDRVEAKVDGLYGELARHTQAILEAMSTQISVVDEKYADLPDRVSHLERDASRPRRR